MLELHCHTCCSDGSCSPAELLAQAARQGIRYLSITDHDTMMAYSELSDLAKYYKIQLIPGIEISAQHFPSRLKVHILGYYQNWDNLFLQQVCRDMVNRREKASRSMLAKVARLGYKIGPEDVAPLCQSSTNLYKVHIMHALFRYGYSPSINNATLYKKLFLPRGKAFAPLAYTPVEEAVRAVREAGGVAVLAHPGAHKNQHLLPYLMELGIQGIEAYHPAHSPDDIVWCLQKARKYGLVVTGGSDFHGLYCGFPDLLGSKSKGDGMLLALRRKAG